MTFLKNKSIIIKKIINQTNIFIFFLLINLIFSISLQCEISNIKSNNNSIINKTENFDKNKFDDDIKKIQDSFDKIQIDINKIFNSYAEILELNKTLNEKLEIHKKNLQDNYISTYDKNSKEFFNQFEQITGIKNIGTKNEK